MSTKQFTIDNATYNAAMASAVKQDELLSLLTGTIMERGLAAMRLGGELDDRILVPMFMSLPHDIKTRAAAILMHKVVLNGGSVPVTVESFAGQMVNYNTLLAQLLQWNLADFFTWLGGVLSDARPPAVNPPPSTGS